MHHHHVDKKQTWCVYTRLIKSLSFLCITYVNRNGGSQALNYPLHCPCMKCFICIFNHDMCEMCPWFLVSPLVLLYSFRIWYRVRLYIFRDVLVLERTHWIAAMHGFYWFLSKAHCVQINLHKLFWVKMAKYSWNWVYFKVLKNWLKMCWSSYLNKHCI